MKISFIKQIVLVIFISLMLTGCSERNLSDKLIDSGKNAIESMEYDKALDLFIKAKEEKAKQNQKVNEEINILIEIISDYKEAIRSYNAKNYDRAKEIINNINENYVNYKIKDDIDYLKNLINKNR